METPSELIRESDVHIGFLEREIIALRSLNARRRARIAAEKGGDPLAHTRKISFGLDYAYPMYNMDALHRSGATFAGRYLASDKDYHNPKDLVPRESAMLKAHGFGRVVVWETAATRSLSGTEAGVADAGNAQEEATACGKPTERPIYFAVDFDANPHDVKMYFQGVNLVLGRQRTGVYGGYDVVKFLMQMGYCNWGWQTLAWSRGLWYPPAQMQQYSIDHVVFGISADYNRGMTADFGQW
jgi:hypothetical protein